MRGGKGGGTRAKFDDVVGECARDEHAKSRGRNTTPASLPPGEAIPLLFFRSAEKFRCSADLIPLLRSAAEMTRKQLIYRDILGDGSGFFYAICAVFR
jgi:hypothetical protein